MPKDDWAKAREIDEAKRASAEFAEFGQFKSYESVFEDLYADDDPTDEKDEITVYVPEEESQADPAGISARLGARNKPVREAAVREAIASRTPVDVPDNYPCDNLIALFKNDCNRTRDWARTQLVKQSERGVAALLRALNSQKKPIVPVLAIRTLGDCGTHAAHAIPILCREAESNNDLIAREATKALHKLAVPCILPEVRSNVPSRQIAAIELLGRLRTASQKVVTDLAEASLDDNVAVRTAAVHALVEFGARAEPGIRSLKQAWQKGDKAFQAIVMDAIKTIEDECGAEERRKDKNGPPAAQRHKPSQGRTREQKGRRKKRKPR